MADSDEGARARLRHSVRLSLVVLLLCLLPLLAIAGGLGIATAMAVVGIGTALVSVTNPKRSVPMPWFWAVLALALWCLVTTLWSPHERFALDGNAMKVLLGAILYTVAAAGIVHTAARRPHLLQRLVTFGFLFLLAITAIDLASDYGLTFLVDAPSPGENLEAKRGDAEMNVGHGITFLLLLFPAFAVMTLQTLSRYEPALAWLAIAEIVAALAICAWMSRLWVGLLVLLMFTIIAVIAAWRPRVAVKLSGGLAALSIMAAPLIGWLAARVDAGTKAALPFSWEHRLEGWAFVGEKIWQAPLLGHGFDASRTFDQTLPIRGFDMSLVSLHPHNAGLHIWLETGLIGALLATLAVIALTRMALRYVGHDTARGIAVSGFIMAALLISGISYGVWQEWWWASLFLAAALIPVTLKDTWAAA